MSGPETAAGRAWLGHPGDQGRGGYDERRKAILAIEAEARAAAVAPYVEALRACIAGFDEWDAERGRAPLPGIPERWWQASEAARRLLSAPSPVREPEGLDVERLARIVHDRTEAWEVECRHWNQHHWTCRDDAREIAAEYARLAPERPADEVDG